MKKPKTIATTAPKTKRTNGKQKGNSFERKMANLLSERFKEFLGIEKGFRRSSDSGSFFGGSNISRVDSYDLDHAVFGDLICPKSFKFAVECKHYKTAPSFQSFLTKNITQWDTWLSQAKQDSEASKKSMLLIVKYNNVEEIVFLEKPLKKIEIFKYKEFYVYSLTEWLTQSDTNFFNKK